LFLPVVQPSPLLSIQYFKLDLYFWIDELNQIPSFAVRVCELFFSLSRWSIAKILLPRGFARAQRARGEIFALPDSPREKIREIACPLRCSMGHREYKFP
jgi:hypothetical protein